MFYIFSTCHWSTISQVWHIHTHTHTQWGDSMETRKDLIYSSVFPWFPCLSERFERKKVGFSSDQKDFRYKKFVGLHFGNISMLVTFQKMLAFIDSKLSALFEQHEWYKTLICLLHFGYYIFHCELFVSHVRKVGSTCVYNNSAFLCVSPLHCMWMRGPRKKYDVIKLFLQLGRSRMFLFFWFLWTVYHYFGCWATRAPAPRTHI